MLVIYFILMTLPVLWMGFRYFKFGFYFEWTLFSWALIFIFIPLVYVSLGDERFNFFLADLNFSLWYASAVSLFVFLLPKFFLLSRPKNIYIPINEFFDFKFNNGNSHYFFVLVLIFISILIVYKFLSADSYFNSLVSRSDILMADQERQAKFGSGGEMFVKAFNYVSLGFIGVLYSINKYEIRAKLIFIFIIFFELLLILTSGLFRSPILTNIIFGIAAFLLIFEKNGNKIYKYLFLFLILLPIYMTISALYRDGLNLEVESLPFLILVGLNGFATVGEISNLLDGIQSGELYYENGMQFIYNLITFVPRFIWEDKPLTSFSYRLSEQIFGEIDVGKAWIHTFTVLGEGFLQFGGPGMLLASIIALFICFLSFKIISLFPRYRLASLLYILGLPLSFRGDLNAMFGRFYELIIALIFFIIIYQFFLFISMINFSMKKRL
jgi:hypothetical protein